MTDETNNPTGDDIGGSDGAVSAGPARRPWRAPELRKIEAVGAQVPPKKADPGDLLHHS